MDFSQLTGIGYNLLFAILVFAAFWLLSRLAAGAVNRLADRFNLHPSLRSLLRQTCRHGLLIVGAVTALGTAGVDTTAIVAGLGLSGFALGFALKDALANLVAGVLILIYRPYQVGDRVDVAGKQGTVKSIDLRYTELEADVGRVLIPNQSTFNNAVVVRVAA
jgi:small conductance mechanosensitive channel